MKSALRFPLHVALTLLVMFYLSLNVVGASGGPSKASLVGAWKKALGSVPRVKRVLEK